MCAKKKADGFVFIKHDSRSVGPPPPLDDPLPGTRQELMYEFRQLLNALHLVQDEVTGSRGLIRDPALPFRFTMIYNKRMQRTVVGLRDGLREVHRTAIPQIDGKAVQSYCEGVVDLCAERLQFLMQFVRVRRGDPAGPSVEELADQMVQSLSMIRESWSFEMLDVDDLWKRLQWEIDQIDAKLKAGSAPEVVGGASKVSLDAMSLGVFIEHPDWTKKKIADHLGCNEKSLAPKRCPKLAAAILASRAPDPSQKVRRGSIDNAGNLEAWSDDKRIR